MLANDTTSKKFEKKIPTTSKQRTKRTMSVNKWIKTKWLFCMTEMMEPYNMFKWLWLQNKIDKIKWVFHPFLCLIYFMQEVKCLDHRLCFCTPFGKSQLFCFATPICGFALLSPLFWSDMCPFSLFLPQKSEHPCKVSSLLGDPTNLCGQRWCRWTPSWCRREIIGKWWC